MQRDIFIVLVCVHDYDHGNYNHQQQIIPISILPRPSEFIFPILLQIHLIISNATTTAMTIETATTTSRQTVDHMLFRFFGCIGRRPGS